MTAVLAAVALAGPALGRTVLDMDANLQPVELQDWGDEWIDTTGSAKPETVATDPSLGWRPTRPGSVYPLGKNHALWIRFTVPPAPDSERWYLDIPVPSVDRVTLYTPDSVGEWLPMSAGDALPVARWPVPHRHPLFPIQVSAEEPRKYLLRIENSRHFSARLSFVSESYFSLHQQRASMALGIYFGLAILVAALALISALSLRDGAYASTALAVTLMGLTQACFTGVAGLHLWPYWPRWNDVSTTVMPILSAGSLAWCYLSIVSLRQRSRLLYQGLGALAMLAIPLAIAAMWVGASNRYLVLIPYVFVTTAAGLAIIGWAARRGDRQARWLILASLPLMAGAVFPIARTLGLVEASFWTTYSLQVGTAIQWPALLVILVRRSQQRREMLRRMLGLDRIDPATGLINAHEFKQRLLHTKARSERLGYNSAVLVVDIVNVAQISQTFGRARAEEMPLRVASRLVSIAREIDSVSRLHDFRFGILVEGPLTAEEAAAIAPRIIARCLMPFKDMHLDCVPQVQVAEALLPLCDGVAGSIVDRLEEVLNAAPLNSERKVFTLTPTGVLPLKPSRRRTMGRQRTFS